MNARDAVTVSELSARIVRTLEKNYPEVWVRGEIGNFHQHSSGHWYFNLKDARASIRAAMFKNVNRLLAFTPREGDEVIVRGRVSGYAPQSVYQIQAEWMEPAGVGKLYLEFEKLKKQLAAEGLFDPARKRPILSPLKRVAIITSVSGAALQDMLRILSERDPGIEVLIVHSQVQGEGAAESLARALEAVNRPQVARAQGRRPVEAVIIGRGGGAVEDLWAFNEEVVARAIASSSIPVISAVGHEIDFTIADFVADLRAPTPTAAAEMVSRGRIERRQRMDHSAHRLIAAMKSAWKSAALEVETARERLSDPSRAIIDFIMRVDDLDGRLERGVFSRIDGSRRDLAGTSRELRARDPRAARALNEEKLRALAGRLARAAAQNINGRGRALALARARLRALSPRVTLARGFAIVRDQTGAVVRDAEKVSAGDRLDVILHQGGLGVSVEKIRKAKEES